MGIDKTCSCPGSNRGPCACEAHVITTTPQEQLAKNEILAMKLPNFAPPIFQKVKVLPGFEPGTFCVLGRCDNHYTTAPSCELREVSAMGYLEK